MENNRLAVDCLPANVPRMPATKTLQTQIEMILPLAKRPKKLPFRHASQKCYLTDVLIVGGGPAE